MRSEISERIFIPKDFQTDSIKFMLSNPEGGLFLATGLGKTIVFLSTFYILKQQGIVSSALVVAKRRIIHNVWPREVAKWGLDLELVKVTGTEKQRLKALETPGDIHLITYQSLDWLSRVKPSALYKQWDVLCLDESSMVKNWNAARTRRLRRMLPHFDRRHIMTASPIPKSMMDIFSQIYCLDMGDALGRVKGAFKADYWTKEEHSGAYKVWHEWILADGAEERIYEDIKHLVIRFPKDVIDLPPLHSIERVVQLPEAARKSYRELEERRITEFEEGVVIAANAGVAVQKLRQMTGGAVYLSDEEYDDTIKRKRRAKWTEVHDAKIDELRELIEELQGEPLLIAYEFDHERQRIQAAFDKHIPHIGGGTTDAEADRLIALWNAGKLSELLGHPDSIAHGLNLQDAGWNICFFSLGWNLENHTQFIDRVYRQGQEHAVWVYLLIAEDTVDEAVVLNLEEKGINQDRFLAAIEAHIRRPKDMHEWKKAKVPPQQLTTEKIIEHLLTAHKASWVPTYDDTLGVERAIYTLASSILVAIAGWIPSRHASFLVAVYGERMKKETRDKKLGALQQMTQKTIFRALKLDSVDAEAPIIKGKFGAALTYITTDPRYVKRLWPVHIDQEKDSTMAKKKATTKKKAPAKAKASPKAKVEASKDYVKRVRSLDLKAKVVQGNVPPKPGTINGELYRLTTARGCSVGALINKCAKKMKHDKADDVTFIRNNIRRCVKRGHLNFEG